MSYFRKILEYARPYKKYAILNIISNVFYAIFSTLSFLAFIPMLEVLFQVRKPIKIRPEWTDEISLKDYAMNSANYLLNRQVDEYGPIAALVSICMAVIILFFFKNLFNYLALYFVTFLRNGMLEDIRNAVYAKLVTLPVSFFSEKRKGDFIARITGDVQEIQNSFLSMLEMFVKEPLTLLFTLGAMIVISPQLTLFVFIFLPISGLIISSIGKKLKSRSTKAQQENAYFLSIVEETLSSLKIIKGFNAERRFTEKFEDSTGRLRRIMNGLLNRQGLASPMSEFLGVVVITIILWFGGRMVLVDKTMEASTFIGFLVLAYNILTPAKAISKATYSVQKGNAAAERVLEVIETPSHIVDAPDAVELSAFAKAITLENVSFQYEEEKVLKNFSVTVPKGHTVALVGQSGSGKSTIANLVTRFYDVNSGSIRIDGQDIRQVTKKSLRSLMGLVTQDSILFNDTVRGNLQLGKPDATDEELIDALKIANAWEFVQELPKGLDTNIGDSGNKLSGGQKQRLSIARAVLKNPPLMILDEATSALDTESERAVQKALENMMQNRTSIVIAHRLSTIQNADLIVVMQKGEIVEQGKHQELMSLGGVYSKLVAMQSLD
ncbi:ABC transporter ATP-binding protein [Croceiramulus getboli]|nr:ABC transporter ATP-binding protein [Flavobacteriaceae bacterium YJPT1-3]